MSTKLEYRTDFPIYSDKKIGMIQYQTAPNMPELYVEVDCDKAGLADPTSIVKALRVLANASSLKEAYYAWKERINHPIYWLPLACASLEHDRNTLNKIAVKLSMLKDDFSFYQFLITYNQAKVAEIDCAVQLSFHAELIR